MYKEGKYKSPFLSTTETVFNGTGLCGIWTDSFDLNRTQKKNKNNNQNKNWRKNKIDGYSKHTHTLSKEKGESRGIQQVYIQ